MDRTQPATIGEHLRQTRQRRRLSQHALAQLAGLPQSTIVRIELGQHAPQLITVQRLISALTDSPRPLEDNHIGQRLRMTRQQHGLTQAQLAQLVDATRDTVSRIERGKHLPRTDTIIQLADALAVNPWWLMLGDDTNGQSP